MSQIVVVGPNCWGAGKSLRQAVAKARINYPFGFSNARGACNSMPYNAYEASDDFAVDGNGIISASELKKIREVRYQGGKQVARSSNFES